MELKGEACTIACLLDKGFTEFSRHTTILAKDLVIDVNLDGFDIFPEDFYPARRFLATDYQKVTHQLHEQSIEEIKM